MAETLMLVAQVHAFVSSHGSIQISQLLIPFSDDGAGTDGRGSTSWQLLQNRDKEGPGPVVRDQASFSDVAHCGSDAIIL